MDNTAGVEWELNRVLERYPQYKKEQDGYFCSRHDGAVNTMISLHGDVLTITLYCVGRTVLRKSEDVRNPYSRTKISTLIREFEAMIV